MLAGFRSAYVLDVSQTEGKELPTIRGISGDVGENCERLFAFVERQGIELFFAEDIAPALGMSYRILERRKVVNDRGYDIELLADSRPLIGRLKISLKRPSRGRALYFEIIMHS
jgi:hypothetical protein